MTSAASSAVRVWMSCIVPPARCGRCAASPDATHYGRSTPGDPPGQGGLAGDALPKNSARRRFAGRGARVAPATQLRPRKTSHADQLLRHQRKPGADLWRRRVHRERRAQPALQLSRVPPADQPHRQHDARAPRPAARRYLAEHPAQRQPVAAELLHRLQGRSVPAATPTRPTPWRPRTGRSRWSSPRSCSSSANCCRRTMRCSGSTA